jgi:hypothetical protein
MPRRRNSDSKPSAGKNPTKRIVDCLPGQEFVFVTPDGKIVGKAKNIIEFIRQVKTVPIESVLYHANGNHFAPWLGIIGEKAVAKRVSEIRGNGPEIRLQLIRCI